MQSLDLQSPAAIVANRASLRVREDTKVGGTEG